jgi:hypothetical protein
MLDPVLDVLPSIADMSAYSEAWWSFASIPPLVESGYRHSEIVGELLNVDKPVVTLHALDHRWAPSQFTLNHPVSV